MKLKQIIAVASLCFFTLTLQAQDVSVYFVSMPEDLIPFLEINRRKDLVDLYNAGREAKVQDSFKSETVLRKMDNNYLSLQSGILNMEMMMLSLVNNSQIICLIQTTCAPLCDSRISFYTINWEKLDTEDFFLPASPIQFFNENQDTAIRDLIQSAASEISLMQYSLNPADLTLTQTYHSPPFWDKEYLKQIKPYMKENTKVFRWQKNQFK